MAVSKIELDREAAAAPARLRQMSMHYCILCDSQGTILRHYCRDNDTRLEAMSRFRNRKKFDLTPEVKPLLTVDIGGRIMKH